MKITRTQAWDLLTEKMQNQNLRRHCLSVEAVMRVLAGHFKADVEKWGIVGLLHDGDYELVKDQPAKHTLLMHDWLQSMGEDDSEVLQAILSHNFAHTGQNPPQNDLEWSLYCCDELTGLIVAVTLVQPTKKLADVTVENIMKKWPQKSFAAGVDREQIAKCETVLGIKVEEFVALALSAMQQISDKIGL
jgi:predicted hydrolase (HD superfamily)